MIIKELFNILFVQLPKEIIQVIIDIFIKK